MSWRLTVFEEKTLELQTRCHGCIFAEFNNDVQIGCKLGRSSKFQQQGKTTRKTLDNVEAYEISTVCNTYRDQEWADNSHQTENIDSNDIKQLADSVLDFVQPRVDFIIVEDSDDDLETVEKKFITTISSILTHTILPQSVVFVVNNDGLFTNIRSVLDLIDSMLIDSGIDYQLVRNIEKPVEYFRLLDVGVTKGKGLYYTHYDLGVEVPSNIISSLDHAINQNLWTVCYVEAQDNHSEVVQGSLHKLVGGNEGSYIKDKINKLAESQQNKHKMMYTWEQLNVKKLS